MDKNLTIKDISFVKWIFIIIKKLLLLLAIEY